MGRVFRAAVVTVSDGVTHGTRTDDSGDIAERLLVDAGFEVADRSVVPDERPEIEARLRELVDGGFPLVVTTGGTGFGPRDVTPEATLAVIEREAPGLTEAMRMVGLGKTPMAALSRAVAGTRGRTLILNLPGSPRGVDESLEAVLPVVTHAVELITGLTGEHPSGRPASAPLAGTRPEVAAVAAEAAAVPRVEVVAVKVEGSPPCSAGNRMTIEPGGSVHGTLGCAEFDAAAAADAVAVAEAGEPQTRTYRHELGSVEVYLEPHLPARRLIVVSATDVARALRRYASRLGYETEMIEPRLERWAAEDREAPGGVAASIGRVPEGRTDVVFTDHDAPGLAALLAEVLRSPAAFIGVMGSRGHVGHHLEELRGMGFSDEELGRIRTPVGLDLGGRTPEEIAISIAAGLVAARHGRDGGWLHARA
jgi:molybdenum cofactor synthesis domain-containing protein